MRVLRRFASRVYLLWSQSFQRLKRPGRYLRSRINRRCRPWVDSAQRFVWTEGVTQSFAKNEAQRARTVRSHSSTGKRSTARALLSLDLAKRTWVVTLLAFLLLTACFGQRFYSQPGLDVKSVSSQTFYAPESAVFEDRKETENQRNSVRDGAVQILKVDADLTAGAEQSLEMLLEQGRELREEAGSPPFLNLEILSKPTQDFLFQASESQWQTVWRLAGMTDLASSQLAPSQAEDTPALPPVISAQVRSLLPSQVAALQELVTYREQSGGQGLELLQTRIDTRRKQYRKAADKLAAEASTAGQPLYNYRLFELSDKQWFTLESTARRVFSEMMVQGIHPGSPPDLIRRAVEARLPAGPNSTVRQLTADVLSSSLSPNLVLDEERTKLHAEQVVNEIAPVMISVQKGDLIVRDGEAIDSTDFALLDYFDLTGRYFNWVGLCGFSVLMAGAVALYLWVDHHQIHQLKQRDHLLVLILCLVVSVLAGLRVPTIGLPAVGLLVGSFYGSALGITVVGLLALMLPIGTPVSAIPLIAGTAAAMLGALSAPKLRSREEFALLGGFVGLTQASVHLIITLARLSVATPVWKVVVIGSAMHGLYGIVWSVIALGVSPYLEHLFDVVTPIRLAELSNPNRALLKRLAAEAPGTFQHTMSVSNLAEAAARALGRNVELVRAGTLYHDIGKMHDPQSFIENQMGGPNKHDLIDDPWKSASIIKKHVTLGLVMANKYRLPQAVKAFIPEHQGDMKISYFYYQAKERQAAEPSLVINEADFSYEGPIPQSPETGITMLADSCEAALRSLTPEASIDEAYTMVDKILRARWRSRQLVDSGLAREDMDVIASVFIQVWQQHNHKRISYPKDVLAA
ncbi:MAG: HDIG domain-containing metalloprotein [Phormidesmis sp.]